LFFPTLGAFSFLFVSRSLQLKQMGGVILGACLSSTIGTLLYALDSGVLSLFITILSVILLINKFNWNAPPILAVAIIPFFVKADSFWLIPISVFVSLLGLLGTLAVVYTVEKRFGGKLPLFDKYNA
jgi:hypothetical protein